MEGFVCFQPPEQADVDPEIWQLVAACSLLWGRDLERSVDRRQAFKLGYFRTLDWQPHPKPASLYCGLLRDLVRTRGRDRFGGSCQVMINVIGRGVP